MNIFIIPSWYPTKKAPTAGIFFKEQAQYLAELYPDYNIGVSLWGQNDPDLEIRIKEIFKVPVKINYYLSQTGHKNQIQKNLCEYYTPALTWTEKIGKGNFDQVIAANLSNLNQFTEVYGKADIIHAHVSYPAGYIAMALSKKLTVPYVITEHMGPFPFPVYITKDGNISTKVTEPIKKASKVIAVSPALAQRISSFNLPHPVFIPNVVNNDFFKESPAPKKSATAKSSFVFFTLANLSPEKGITDLLNAVALVVKKEKDVQFNIGGGGEYLEYYISLTKEMQLDNYVCWLGSLSRERARDEYHNCHAFVLPSHHETFGVVYAEAIACGKPIIATRCGGPECIVNEENGLLTNINAPEELANNMLWMMQNHTKYNASEIRKDFEIRFSKKAVIPQIVNIYKEVLSK